MNKTLFFGLIGIVIIFSLVGCDTGNGTTTFTVTFNSNDGSNVSAISGISSGATIALPTNPTKQNYIFDGWYIDNVTFTDEFTSLTPVTQNITVYAKWTPVSTEKTLVGVWSRIIGTKSGELTVLVDNTCTIVLDDSDNNDPPNIVNGTWNETNIILPYIDSSELVFIYSLSPDKDTLIFGEQENIELIGGAGNWNRIE